MAESMNALAAKCQQGDKDAWQQLVESLHPQVESHVVYILKRYGMTHLINNHLQDIVNYIWEDLIKNLFKFKGHDFEIWTAFRRAKRVLDYIRKEGRYQPVQSGGDHNLSMADASFCTDVQDQIYSQQILVMVDKLPIKYALFIKLYYWKGLPYKDIAQLLGIKSSSVGSLHGRAIKKFKKLHKKEIFALI